MRVLELLILFVFVHVALSSPICTICESTIKATASTLSFMIPDFIAVEGL